MAKFIYKAKRGLDEVVEGTIEAQNQDDALYKLASTELYPFYISEVAPLNPESAEQKLKAQSLLFSRSISSREILIFSRKLLILIRAKVELLSCLRIIYEQTENTRMREAIQSIYEFTKEGRTFSESLAAFPKVFSPLFINIIKAGETSGRLDYAMEQITEFLQREDSLKTKIRVALAYPTLLLGVGLVSIFVLMSFVVPRLRPIFESANKELPLITKVVLNMSTLSSKSWFWVLGVIIVAAALIYQRKGIPFYNKMIRKLKLSLPIVKRLVKNQELAHFSRAFNLLLSSGVVALKALEISTLTVDDPKLNEELKNVYAQVAAGQSLSKSMESSTGLPKFFVKMIAVGEESGRLTEVLGEILNSYNQQIDTDITLISSLLEPLLILSLGLVLGSIVLSILLPTFEITQMVH